ncbi:MAG: thiaminase II [Acidobacteriota bacterium]|jgi:thiaminase/transcriptional activator TenA
MDYPGFVGEMRKRTEPLWSAIHDHPFVRGLGNGSLAQECFELYLEQDYVYLIGFSQVIALAAAKAEDLETRRFFCDLLEATLETEMELHRKTCADHGITPLDLEATEPALATMAYTDLLLRTCYEGRPSDINAVLLPCAAGYVEIAERLREAGPPRGAYRDWIDMYSSEGMKEMADWLVRRMNRHAEKSSPEDRARWLRLYRSSTRLELLFFEMAWSQVTWPDCIPA